MAMRKLQDCGDEEAEGEGEGKGRDDGLGKGTLSEHATWLVLVHSSGRPQQPCFPSTRYLPRPPAPPRPPHTHTPTHLLVHRAEGLQEDAGVRAHPQWPAEPERTNDEVRNRERNIKRDVGVRVGVGRRRLMNGSSSRSRRAVGAGSSEKQGLKHQNKLADCSGRA